jgi:ABC-type branched-subunit amino acid transport system substrate-binding protein
MSSQQADARFISRVHVVDGSEIKLGMSVPETGRIGFLGSAVKQGCLACFTRANREGGISGRNVVLITYDDHNEPVETVSNTERLIDHDKVFGAFELSRNSDFSRRSDYGKRIKHRAAWPNLWR